MDEISQLAQKKLLLKNDILLLEQQQSTLQSSNDAAHNAQSKQLIEFRQEIQSLTSKRDALHTAIQSLTQSNQDLFNKAEDLKVFIQQFELSEIEKVENRSKEIILDATTRLLAVEQREYDAGNRDITLAERAMEIESQFEANIQQQTKNTEEMFRLREIHDGMQFKLESAYNEVEQIKQEKGRLEPQLASLREQAEQLVKDVKSKQQELGVIMNDIIQTKSNRIKDNQQRLVYTAMLKDKEQRLNNKEYVVRDREKTVERAFKELRGSLNG